MREKELVAFENSVKKMTKRISKMSASEYEEFMNKFIDECDNLQTEILEKENELADIRAEKSERDFTDEAIAVIVLSSEFACMIAGGAIAGATMGGTNNILGGAVGGMLVGIIVSLINGMAYSAKPVSNFLNQIKEKVVASKLERANKKHCKKKKTIEVLEEFRAS